MKPKARGHHGNPGGAFETMPDTRWAHHITEKIAGDRTVSYRGPLVRRELRLATGICFREEEKGGECPPTACL